MSEQPETGRGREATAGYSAPSPADGPTRPAAPGVSRSDDTAPSGPSEAVTEPSATRPTGLRPARGTGSRPGRTRLSGTWVGLILGAVVLVFLLVFVVQNLAPAEVAFLGWRATLPLGVWLLFSAVAGILLLAIPGLGRMVQWRRASGSGRRR